jgi:hypothetical protein
MALTTDTGAAVVRSLIPARLDRLPWTRFHTRLIMALGTAWILDGLEITLAGAVAGVLTKSDTLHLSSAEQQPLEAVARPLSAVAPLHKAAYSPGMLPSGTGTSAAA